MKFDISEKLKIKKCINKKVKVKKFTTTISTSLKNT